MKHGPPSPEMESSYNLIACIEATRTRSSVEYTSYSSAGGSWPGMPFYAETRFMPGDIQIDDGELLTTPVTEMLPQILDIPPTKEDLRELANSADRNLLGPQILADAREIALDIPGIFSSISAIEAVALLGRHPNYATEHHFLGLLKEKGNVIVPASNTEPAQFVISPGDNWSWPGKNEPASMEHINARFLAINLDVLEQERPGLVRQRLLEWHVARAQANFVYRGLKGIASHEQPLEARAPRFLLELANIVDDEQRETEMSQCQAILDRIATLANSPHDVVQSYHHLLQEFYDDTGALHRGISKEDEVWLSEALYHIAECSGSTSTQAAEAMLVDTLRAQFAGREPVPEARMDNADLDILAQPAAYLLFDSESEALQAFLARHNMTAADFVPLGDAQEHPNSILEDPPGGYEILANVLIMTKQGRANIFSPVQRALIEHLYRFYFPETLQNITATWSRLDATLNNQQ